MILLFALLGVFVLPSAANSVENFIVELAMTFALAVLIVLSIKWGVTWVIRKVIT